MVSSKLQKQSSVWSESYLAILDVHNALVLEAHLDACYLGTIPQVKIMQQGGKASSAPLPLGMMRKTPWRTACGRHRLGRQR